MTPSFQDAVYVDGKSIKSIALSCGVTTNTFWAWSTGRRSVPAKKRQTVDRAIGTPVDWNQFDREYMALNDTTAPKISPSGQIEPKPAPDSRKAVTLPPAPQISSDTPIKDDVSEYFAQF